MPPPWVPPPAPAVTTFEESWQVHEAYLYALLLSAATVGSGGPLDLGPALAIERMSPPEGDVFPILGFVYQSTDRDDAGSPLGQEAQINYFELSITVVGGFEAGRADTARAAFEAVEKWVNDRHGNGVLPLLRMDSTLGGTADWCHVQNGQLGVDRTVSGAESAIYRAQIVTHGKVYTS